MFLTSLLFLGLISPNFSEIISTSLGDTNEILEDLSHPCVRECERGESKVCKYTFTVEWYTSMGKACYDCPHNLSHCALPHCAPADGYERPLVTVNRRLPGPYIQVCQWDEVVVDVVNELGSDSTSIHWHGIHQRGTPYMDGVPLLTQCPIPPGTTFRYHFLADQPGTHYWHSHSGFQRTDGMFGALVVNQPREEDTQRHLFDTQDPKHTFLLTDWLDGLGIAKFVNHHHTEHDNKPYNILVNGRGKCVLHERGNKQVFTPVYEATVIPGKRHRFRAISNSIQNCPIVISIDNHTLLPIATDGHPIQPVEVESLTIYGGERWDFVVTADKEIGSYWIKFQGMLDCDERFKAAYQVAVMRYKGAIGLPGPLEDVNYFSTIRKGLMLNKLNAAPGDGETFLTAAEIRAPHSPNPIQRQSPRKPDYKFWLDFDFYGKDNPHFHHPDYYPFYGVKKSHRLFTPQINEISLRLPTSPPLSQPGDVDSNTFCNGTHKKNCKEEFCHCPHVLNVEKNSLVELILVDEGVVYWANHPFHLHGHAFQVLAMGRLGENTTKAKIQALDEAGKIVRNYNNPPTKDTVTVPDGGYTIIQFIASNPGYWLFHCHISFHIEVGMGLVFRVGGEADLPPPPKDFPKCGPWTPKIDPNFKVKLENYFRGQKGQVDVTLWPQSEHGPSYTSPGHTEEENGKGTTENGKGTTENEIQSTENGLGVTEKVEMVVETGDKTENNKGNEVNGGLGLENSIGTTENEIQSTENGLGVTEKVEMIGETGNKTKNSKENDINGNSGLENGIGTTENGIGSTENGDTVIENGKGVQVTGETIEKGEENGLNIEMALETEILVENGEVDETEITGMENGHGKKGNKGETDKKKKNEGLENSGMVIKFSFFYLLSFLYVCVCVF